MTDDKEGFLFFQKFVSATFDSLIESYATNQLWLETKGITKDQRAKNLARNWLDVKTSTIETDTNPINFIQPKASANVSFQFIDAWRIRNAITLLSITKEQNWPKNVTAFFLFRRLIVSWSKRRRIRSLLSCVYIWWKKQM